jgi:phage FluMu gp28-like protein
MASSANAAVPLYRYQRNWIADKSKFKIGMMSRQSGKTFTCTLEIADDCVEAESKNQRARWVILSRGERQAREAMEEGVKRHLAAYQKGFEAYEYDWDPDVKAQEIVLPGGSRITALPANPDTARGFSANLLLDEFAFHKDSRGIWKACFPLVSKPGLKLRVISTPNGKSNKFYELMTDAGTGWSRHTTDIYQAVADGLPRNIDELRAGINDPDAWEQEYECKFVDEATAYITYEMITSCEDEKATKELPGPLMIGPEYYLGMDIGRKKDLTIIWLWEKVGDVLWTRMVKKLFREKFSTQREVLFAHLPFIRRACIDATGLGTQLGEEAVERFGSKVEAVTFTGPVKEDLAVTIRRRFEDRTCRVPIDREIRDDLHSVKKITTAAGNIRFDAERTEDGHADRFWAAALGTHAASTPAAPIEFQSTGQAREHTKMGGYFR